MEKKASILKPALIYGAIVGFVGILLSVIFYVMDMTTVSWTQYVSMLIGIVVLAYCLVAYRKEYLGGFASYGQIFLMALLIGVVSTIISTAYSYILFNVIDAELLDKLRLAAEEKVMNNPRIPDSMMDEMIERVGKNFEPRRMLISGIVMGIVGNAILGLIMAAFIKKEETPLDSVV
jgi:ABC-type Fe3+-siderophore transport system permease subunit